MRAYFLFIITLLAFSALAHSTPAQVAKSYTEPDEQFRLEKITADGNNYWIVVIDGSKELLIDSSDNLVDDKGEIERIFTTNLIEESEVSVKTDAIRDGIDAFNASQYPNRTDCERITGVDKKECYDKESCIKACYAVPLCAMQIRDDLIDSILEWNTLRAEVDSAIQNAKNKADALNGEDADKYRDVKNAIQNMIDKMEEFENANLYSIAYCAPMEIDYDAAEDAAANADSVWMVLGSYDDVVAEANELHKNMNERVEYFSNRAEMYQNVYSQVLNLYNEVSNEYEKQRFTEDEIDEMLSDASNYTSIMKQLKSSGRYREAIDAGNEYVQELNAMKNRIKVYSVQYEVLKNKADDALERIEKAKLKVKSRSSKHKLDGLKAEINRMINFKIDAKNISSYSERIDEINDEVKTIVANAVLEEEEESQDAMEDAEQTVKEEVEVDSGEEKEELKISDVVLKSLCNALHSIGEVLGVDVAGMLGVCG